jgi:hypothetical protein
MKGAAGLCFWLVVDAFALVALVRNAPASPSLFFPRSPAEIAAGITPTNYSYKPGVIWRYGAACDGQADDTVAFANMLASGAPELIVEGGICAISGNQRLSANGTRLITRNATLKVRNEVGIASARGLINVSADDAYLDVEIDHNELGLTGVVLDGNHGYVRVKSRRLRGSARSRGYESGVLVNGSYNTVWVEGYDHTQGEARSGAVPRVVSVQGNGTGTWIEMLKGRNVQDGLVASHHSDITIVRTDLENVADNGFYILTNTHRLKVRGGTIKGVGEPLVIKGSDHEIDDLLIVNADNAITLENASRVRLRRIRSIHTDDSHNAAFIGTRGKNFSSTDIILENCHVELYVASGGIATFPRALGAVNNFEVLGGFYKLMWSDLTTAHTKILRHELGNAVLYRDVVVELEDHKTAPLTWRDRLDLDIPRLSSDSVFENVSLINHTAGRVRVGTIGGMRQSLLRLKN